jgi:hypothetical protein
MLTMDDSQQRQRRKHGLQIRLPIACQQQSHRRQGGRQSGCELGPHHRRRANGKRSRQSDCEESQGACFVLHVRFILPYYPLLSHTPYKCEMLTATIGPK